MATVGNGVWLGLNTWTPETTDLPPPSEKDGDTVPHNLYGLPLFSSHLY
jgi:hypothetical protein